MIIQDQEKKAKLRRLQTDMIILDSDLKKKMREKELFLAEIKKNKLQESRLRVEISEKEQMLKKMDSDIFSLNNEISSLKKKINLL